MAEMAIGLIETVGLAVAIEVADAMAKSSNIKILEYENTKGSGLITVKIVGDVGAVNAAISAGKAVGEKVNKVYSSLVIPRISKEVYDKMIAPFASSKNGEEAIDLKPHEKSDLEPSLEKVEETIDLVEPSLEKVEEETIDLEPSLEEVEEETIDLEPSLEVEEEIIDLEPSLEVEEETIDLEPSLEKVEEEVIDSEFHEKSDLNLSNDNNIKSEDIKVVTCNLCNDPACMRKKGEPRNLCIHYTGKLNKEEDIKNE